MAEVVIGTAGHVDHGKTELIRALTGADTDRLPDEKRRGISIDLGFTQFQLPSGRRAGIIDVPGHERFIKNMVAGVSGIDVALLVVAADEGVMPQTREHLDILQLLGVPAGVVVVTKADLAEGEWLDLVEQEVRETVAGTFLEDAPVLRTSARSGEGLEALRGTLDALLPDVRPRAEDANARLPVDRVFTVAGFGTVVTGTLTAGAIRAEDRLEVHPGDEEVRVRQVQVHGEKVTEARAGQRAALNLSGVSTEDLHRGQALVTPGSLRAVRLFAGTLALLPAIRRPLKSGARVRVHAGTGEVLGRCLLLDRDVLEPGQRCYALYRTEQDLVVARGDRYIVRRYSPMATIGGGTVLDAGRRYRRGRDEGLRTLRVLERGDPAEVVEALLLQAGRPVAASDLARQANLPPARIARMLRQLVDEGRAVSLEDGAYALHPEVYRGLAAQVRRRLERFHRTAPLRAGLPREELRREVVPDVGARAFTDLLERLQAGGVLEVRDDLIRQAGFRPQLGERLEAALERLADTYRSAGATPPAAHEAAAPLEVSQHEARALFETLEQRGRLARVGDDLYFDAGAYRGLVDAACALIAAEGPCTVAEIRDHLGTSRKYVVPLLEHLDRRRITRRVGDRRELTPRGRERSR